ncbi:MAG: DNA-binding protein WhiA, partial [Clostridia bacterium]|nr:DNA-binding protein WhiA [Clostridia bacterium]
ACGWVSDPEKSYNLEFTVSGEPEAQRLSQCMNAMGYHCGVSHRKSQYVAYLRDFEGVSRLLATLGAHAAYMAYENAYIMKQVTVSVNRQMNCDGSNIEKTVKASQKQIDDINALIAAGVMDGLPASLRDMAQARLQNPDANLTELGQIMSPPLGKSGVNNRLRRLSALAEDLRANGHLPPSL